MDMYEADEEEEEEEDVMRSVLNNKTFSETEDAVRSVLDNKTLSEDEKCFLYLAIAERCLYKNDIPYRQAQFTFEVREDPSDPNRLHCVVERVKLKDKKSRTKRFRKTALAIIAPIIGAVASIYLRYCCSIPTV
jgi:hypothetical protein